MKLLSILSPRQSRLKHRHIISCYFVTSISKIWIKICIMHFFFYHFKILYSSLCFGLVPTYLSFYFNPLASDSCTLWLKKTSRLFQIHTFALYQKSRGPVSQHLCHLQKYSSLGRCEHNWWYNILNSLSLNSYNLITRQVKSKLKHTCHHIRKT